MLHATVRRKEPQTHGETRVCTATCLPTAAVYTLLLPKQKKGISGDARQIKWGHPELLGLNEGRGFALPAH